ncbi:MAG: serine--tRNA ligase, partial [Pseudomonadota bacterium]
ADKETYRTGWNRRSEGSGDVVDEILVLDEAVRAAVTEKQDAEQARNRDSKLIGQAKAKGDEAEFERLRAEVAKAKEVMEKAGSKEDAARKELDDLLAGLPNTPYPDIPDGADESANKEVRKWREPAALGFEAKDHADLGEALGMMDFETAAKMSGARFVLLKGKLAKLERSLTQFMLDIQTEEHGYQECSPPLLVRDHALVGTGQLPKFEEDVFPTGRPRRMLELVRESLLEHGDARKAIETGDEPPISEASLSQWFNKSEFEQLLNESRYLVPTAEVPLTNIVRESIVEADDLPHRFTAATPCFRSEAGSAGRDTRGMIRLHQFTKVEMVSITKPEDSDAELERMTGCAEEILKRLELPYRVVELCAGDIGFGAKRTYDLEVWLPSQETYREISSCSTCGDFQARRMNSRYRPEPTEDTPKPKPDFVHTLNGSGLAVGRCLVAVLENYQNEDGSITVPEALRSYMGGLEIIS